MHVILIALASLLLLANSTSILAAKSLAVTIYNDQFAMVKDVRSISFDQGLSSLSFTDVSSNIQPETVTFKAVTQPENIRVYQQNFEANIVSGNAILSKYIDKEIEVFARFGDLSKRVKGILLGLNNGITIKTQFGIDVFNTVDAYQFPSLPDGFFTLPTLVWKTTSKVAVTTDCEVAYRTTGFSWKSDYSITLNEAETIADVGGWVTIQNHSGKRYIDAKLKLIAGDVNTVINNPSPSLYATPMMAMAGNSYEKQAPTFNEKSFADYHMYTLSDVVSLNDNSAKQVEFIPRVYGINIRKFNKLSMNFGGYSFEKAKATNNIQFNNSANNKLGIPLPKGTVRVFKTDTQDGSLQFIGEDSIDHTPKDENITITTGNAFDISASMVCSSRKTFNSGGYSAEMSLTIANHKQIAAEIVTEFSGSYGDNLKVDWKPTDSSIVKINANLYRFTRVFKAGETYVATWSQSYQS